MAVKRPLPQPTDRMNFKAASAVTPGDLVTVSSSGIAAGGAVDDEYIGIVLREEQYFAANGTDNYIAAANVPVKLRSQPIRGVASSVIAIGNFVIMATSGQIAVESTAGTKTLNTIGIALTAAGTDAEITILPL